MKSTRISKLPIKNEANFNQPLLEIQNQIINKYDGILPYHDANHTTKVVERAFLIGQVLGLNERQLELLQIAASFHDLVSDFNIDEVEIDHKGKKLKIRKRNMKREDNEQASALEAEKWMREKGYLEKEISLVKEAILATIPAWNQEKGTVYQLGLNKDSHPLIRALCFADLGASGISASDYLKDPFKLFLEDYPDFHQFILGKRELSDLEKDFYLTKFREFIRSQANFVQGRKELFESEIEGEGIDEEKKKRLRELFSDFDKSLNIINRKINIFQNNDFDKMVKGFKQLLTDSRLSRK